MPSTDHDIFNLSGFTVEPHHEDSIKQINDIENDLSKYSLNDQNESLLDAINNATSENGDIIRSPISNQSTSSLSAIASDVILPNDKNILPNGLDVSNGIVHGHIHNYENFTYIHGHIHTNDPLQILQNQNPIASTSASSSQVLPQIPQLHRRSSSHRHSNDFHSLQFSDCQHFEFLNCHDNEKNPVDESLKCEEDENCKPKIVEICCDDPHSHGDLTNFFPTLPNCNDASSHNHHHSTATESSSGGGDIIFDQNKERENDSLTDKDIFQHCALDDCVDVKCDLNTCSLDDIYCQFCEDVDKVGMKKEEHHHDLKIDHHSNHQEIQNHEEQQHIFDQLRYNELKRGRDEVEDDDDHHHTYHHFHLHQHNHSDKHHHHQIQLHDHPTKKAKSLLKSDNTIIPFEWNFKNNSKCEWENCSSTLDNPINLQNHILEEHILTEYDTNSKDIGNFECEWKNCDYFTDDLSTLVNHITETHSSSHELNLSDLIIKKEGDIKLNNNIPTPTSDSNEPIDQINSSLATITKPSRKRIPKSEDIEQTICKWMELDANGNFTHQCNLKFANASELQDHLIQDHVGAGKSEYTCCWHNCDRNHRNFNQRQKIIRHLHVHTRYKPFVCSICKHSFAVETMLEQHMRTHSGEKPYVCKICQKTFATSSSLSIHIRTHTGEKPLVCKYPGCGKRFSESSNLTKHMKTHEKTYKCDCCSKSFSKEKQLVSHMNKYHPDNIN